jgi:predicted transposase/invertase (TIGR01784 family)
MKYTPPPMGKYVDPLTDFGFKLLFGSEPNKDLLIAFLNELFKGKKRIADLTYNKSEYHGPHPEYRKSIFDLTCTDDKGVRFMIEVQRARQVCFKDRALYYTAAFIQEQGPKGKPDWDFQLKEVYLIALMDFCLEDTSPEHYLHWVRLTDEATGKVFYEKLGYIFIEIPKFNKPETALETDLDRWLYILKNLSLLQKIPVFLHKRIFEKLFTIAEVSKLTKPMFTQYERSRMARWTEYAVLEAAKIDGAKQGREEGREQGREEGREENSRKIVKNMLAAGKFTIPEIAALADVSQAFVRTVKKNMK